MSLPNYKLGEILRRKQRIKEALYDSSVEQVKYDCYHKLAEHILPLIMDDFKITQKHVENMNSIFVRHQDHFLTPDVIEQISSQIAGWSEELANAIPFTEWNTKTQIWAPLFIEDVERVPSKDKKLYRVTLSSHAGLTSGRKWTKIFTSRFLQGLIRMAGGIKWHKYNDEDISRLWITALLVVVENKMVFKMVHASDSQKRLNKEILEGRQGKCPGTFPKRKNQPCSPCPVSVKQCRFSRHIKEYKLAVCAITPPAHKGFIVRDGVCMHCLNIGKSIEKKNIVKGVVHGIPTS